MKDYEENVSIEKFRLLISFHGTYLPEIIRKIDVFDVFIERDFCFEWLKK